MGVINNKGKSAVLFKRYIWLVELISRKGSLTLKEVQEEWDSSSLNDNRMPLPRETFMHHRVAIESIFGIEIKCNKGTKEYFIDDSFDNINKKSVRDIMINSLVMNDFMGNNKNVKDLVIFEDTYLNAQYMKIITEALIEKRVLDIKYKKFRTDSISEYIAEPKCLKSFRQRWYLICMIKDREGIFSLPLDRIISIEKTSQKFKPSKKFDSESYFMNTFGISVYKDTKPETIIVRTTELKADYLHSAPIHHSQEETKRENGSVYFSFRLAVNYELEMELLRHSHDLEVVSPESLRDRIAGVLRSALERYS